MTNASKSKSAQTVNSERSFSAKTHILRGPHCVHIAGVTGSSPVSPTIHPIENKRTSPNAAQCSLGQLNPVAAVRHALARVPSHLTFTMELT